MITIMFTPENWNVKIEGHAKYADKSDPVCAGVSALTYTLIENMNVLSDKLENYVAETDKGFAEITCKPMEGYEPSIETVLWVIMNGYSAMATAFPDNISLKIV